MMSTFATTYASAFILLAYFIGAIPFGLVLTKLAGMGDIRSIGSGNIGATNVLRTGNKALAAGTLLLDGGKGAGVALLVWGVTGEISLGYLAGFAAFFGHLFPIYLGFKGGKGVATGLGLFLAIEPLIGALACVTWLVVAFMFRYSSLAALTAFILTPLYMVVLNVMAPDSVERSFIMVAVAMAYIVWGRHEENVARLRTGTESKISLGGSNAS